ncbi:hypothetical protein Scep_023092 [Stephania cephalantha]|uniref:START domain-containing protein n=1 Tax=Stephania cephalantha TaxID=152367 RepID=A0AAP0EZF3_9MAGN
MTSSGSYWDSVAPRILIDFDGFWWHRRESSSLLVALLMVLISASVWRIGRVVSSSRWRRRSVSELKPSASDARNSQTRMISDIVSDADLKTLVANLEGKFDGEEKWENVIDKRNGLLSYTAKCCKPKDGPLKYLSSTVFENCSTELLRDFYMDNDYRQQWDKTLVKHEQLQIDEFSGTEIGRTIKKFPLLTPREYVLAWRLWEGEDKTFYCFIKECEHALFPQQKKYVRVRYFRSGWRIRKVPGRDACEIKMVHQEDAGLNVELAKLVFAKGIWSYVCKMDAALRKYNSSSQNALAPHASAVTFMQKVPPEVEIENNTIPLSLVEGTQAIGENKGKKFLRRPSKKVITNSLIIIGVLCLSHGKFSLVAKVAMAGVLKKLSKRGASSSNKVGSSSVIGS